MMAKAVEDALLQRITDTRDGQSAWKDVRAVPAYYALTTVVLLCLHHIVHRITAFRTPRDNKERTRRTDSTEQSGFVEATGSFAMLVYKSLKVLASAAFFGASLTLFFRSEDEDHQPLVVRAAMILTAGYTLLLSLLSLIPSISARSSISTVLNSTLLVTFAIYGMRDLWPYATYDQLPMDRFYGPLLWVIITSTFVAGAVIPLLVPRIYQAVDPLSPMPTPAPEQTASLISLILFTFFDPLVRLGNTVDHLTLDQTPPLPDYDTAEALRARAFPFMDPFTNGKQRHVFWGVMGYFKGSFFIQALMMIGVAVTEMISPIAMNRLLAYIETAGADASVRPWVWIVLLFAGPFGMALFLNWYTFSNTHSVVNLEAIMTQLLFEHVLRSRVSAEAQRPLPPPPGPVVSAAVAPSSTSGSTQAAAPVNNGDSRAATSAPVKSSSSGTQSSQKAVSTDKGKSASAKLDNLISTDLAQIQGARDFLWAVLYSPLEIVLDIVFLYVLLGWSSIVGLVVMVALIPVPAQLTKLFHGVQRDKMKATDARVQSVTEVIGMLRMVKLFAWEDRAKQNIAEKRAEEMGLVWRWNINLVTLGVVNRVIPLIHMVVTYWVYTSVMKQEMTASIVFSSIAVFDVMRDQFFSFMWTVPNMIRAKVSFDRINAFLVNTELLDQYTLPTSGDPRTLINISSHASDIGFGSAHFSWSAEHGARDFVLRVDGELMFTRGGINLVVGPTGSGKTSMIMALLGEMHFVPVGPEGWFNLPRESGVAYAAQESWVQNQTIKDNILFGAPYDEVRYNKVIDQCALRRDLELFSAGDMTEVGERGLTLSGGQKARLTLARAVYSSAEILLFDDVLAALDVHTSRFIVEKCFKGDLIRGRTIILVTHNVALASPIADLVVTLGADGRISSRGSVQEALSRDPTFRKEMVEDRLRLEPGGIDKLDLPDLGGSDTKPADNAKSGKLIVAEELEIGRVSKNTFFLLAKAMAGRWGLVFWVCLLGCLFSSEVLVAGQIWWLGRWATAYGGSGAGRVVDVTFYLGVYIGLIVIGVILYSLGLVMHTVGSVRASVLLHQRLIHSVLQATLRWIDSTPTSRITTRFTQDMDAVDSRVMTSLVYVLDLTGSLIIKLVAVVILTPIFVIPGVFIGVIGGHLANLYMKVQLSVKREMSKAKSPVIGHFSATVAGLVSIRAYGAAESFKTESNRRIDVYSRSGRTFWDINRWISIRIELLSSLFTAALAAYMIYMGGAQNASNVGFSINMAVGFSGLILMYVQIINNLEVQGNSLERIQQYLVIEHEPEATSNGSPPAYWPASGSLVVENLSARYSSNGPQVLKDISFKISSGERIGIVGRTGSGKSSLTLSLLRAILTDGEVYVDGLPTSRLNLESLRANITIIPQVPELLSGTVRHNLDPFNQHDDATLHDALYSSGLTSIQSQADGTGTHLTLESSIGSEGGNLSVGQKQIIALARAMLRRSKIIILDEATSAIDYETDALIQRSLRDDFRDVTFITVAHRMQTVMDCDKIMVLDAGRMVEFDQPITLLENQDGFLYSLVHESLDKDQLIALAQGKRSK